MKRITVFLVALTLLVIPGRAEEAIFDYAEFWRELGETGRFAYVIGVRDGKNRAILALLRLTTLVNEKGHAIAREDGTIEKSEVYIAASKAVHLPHKPTKIAEVMSEHYKDPANSYISLDDMVFVASAVLSGEDVSSNLRAARKAAIDRHALNASMKESKQTR